MSWLQSNEVRGSLQLALQLHMPFDTECKLQTQGVHGQVSQCYLPLSEAMKVAPFQTFEACLRVLAEPCLTLLRPMNC